METWSEEMTGASAPDPAEAPGESLKCSDILHGSSAPDTFWSTTNLAEAFPGVLTPLAWTVCGPALEAAIRAAFNSIGVLSRHEARLPVDDHDRVYEVFFGRPASRVNFLCLVGDRIPGTSGESVAQQVLGSVPPGFQSRASRRRYPAVAVRFPVTLARVPSRVIRVRRDTEDWWRSAVDRAPTLSIDEARRLFIEGVERFTKNLCVQAIAVAAGIQPVYDQFCRLITAAEVPLTDITSGYGSHAEAELISDLWACSRGRIDFDLVVRRHGYHGPRAGELSETTWREDPAPLLRILEAYRAVADDENPLHAEKIRMEQRSLAEAQLIRTAPRSRRARIRLLLGMAHTYLPLRGVAKIAFLQGLDVTRAAARRLGASLAAENVLSEPEDVFYLTAREVLNGPPPGVKAIVGERRACRQLYQTYQLPSFWQGAPEPLAAVAEAPVQDLLRGIGAGAGMAEGQARVVTDPSTAEIQPGDILIAHTTDPSWAAIMFLSAGIVIDIGGQLSHAAVVARELGIPCIVGTEVGTRVLRSGDRCRIDGTAGTVEILERGPS